MRWRLLEPRRLRLGPMLSEDELASVYAARAVLEAQSSPWLDAFERAVVKAEAMVPARVVGEARARVEGEAPETAASQRQ